MSRLFFLVCTACAFGLAAHPVDASEKSKRTRGIENSKQVRAPRVVSPPIVQDYEPDPAIWVLQDEDTRIYLFGTIHLLPQSFRWRSPRLDAIVADADELVVESTDNPEDEELIAAILGSIEERTPVSTRMSAENGEKWRGISQLVEMDPDQFDRIPPILALFGLSMTYYDTATGADPEYGVETLFEADFHAAGKPIGSIEKASDVVKSLLAIDEGLLIEQIERELAGWDGGETGGWLFAPAPIDAAPEDPLADEHAWAKGQEIDLEQEIDDGTELGRLLVKVLLDDRNRAWADWLKVRLDRPGDVLVAVGAAHLAGASSVQNHLRERGLVAERLNPAN